MILNFVALRQNIIQSMYHRFYVNKRPKKTPVHKPRERQHNYLKNWRVVRYYIQKRYDLSLQDLETMLYLYDEGIFDKDTFNDFAKCLSFNKERFSDFRKRELITQWREGKRAKHRQLFQLTHKAKKICNHLYKKLEGEELISEDPYRNNIMKGSSYTDKIYRSLIKKMNTKTTAASHNEE